MGEAAGWKRVSAGGLSRRMRSTAARKEQAARSRLQPCPQCWTMPAPPRNVQMDERALKILVTLGVPGLALGVFFGLYNKFGFTFAPVPANWTGPIAIVFLVLVAAVVIFALRTGWGRSGPQVGSNAEAEPIVPAGYRRLRVVVMANGRTGTIERADVPSELPWDQLACSFVVGFGLPQVPSLYRVLDVDRGAWLQQPPNAGELKTNSQLIGLVDQEAAERYGHDAATVAAVVRAVWDAAKTRQQRGP